MPFAFLSFTRHGIGERGTGTRYIHYSIVTLHSAAYTLSHGDFRKHLFYSILLDSGSLCGAFGCVWDGSGVRSDEGMGWVWMALSWCLVGVVASHKMINCESINLDKRLVVSLILVTTFFELIWSGRVMIGEEGAGHLLTQCPIIKFC
ncbi:hypothetical protein B0H67DRAFT_228778 [Lasiosphaeris hirsuta]|uniref:Uncharacterized protein n=1 Tax=Lasiosphaeris hirsuta TaxID=260670 RepID=A0AA40AFJ9_9PEZI|nr:hypothetical protein B0H67DRAFT_228778 [Lasiosphaeris hirsuta]